MEFVYTLSENANCKVNRKNLGSGGSTTEFKLTVSSNISEEKTIYSILVTRGEYQRDSSSSEIEGNIPYAINIIPSSGELSEEFRSDLYEYSLSVPYEIKEMDFEVLVPEGCTTRINRKNLGSGGSVTDFNIIISSDNSEEKTIYTVSVTRGTYVRTSSSNNTSTGKSSNENTSNENSSSSITDSPNSQLVVYDNYSEGQPLVIKSDSFSPFIFGAVIALTSVIIGGIMLMIVVRIVKKSGKHDKTK